MNYTCNKCGKSMDEINFYTYKNGKKTELCKKCLTMHINNFEPNTFLWALEKMDVPYVPEEWNILRDKAYAKDPYKMNGMSVFGKYLSKMRLKQHQILITVKFLNILFHRKLKIEHPQINTQTIH